METDGQAVKTDFQSRSMVKAIFYQSSILNTAVNIPMTSA